VIIPTDRRFAAHSSRRITRNCGICQSPEPSVQKTGSVLRDCVVLQQSASQTVTIQRQSPTQDGHGRALIRQLLVAKP